MANSVQKIMDCYNRALNGAAPLLEKLSNGQELPEVEAQSLAGFLRVMQNTPEHLRLLAAPAPANANAAQQQQQAAPAAAAVPVQQEATVRTEEGADLRDEAKKLADIVSAFLNYKRKVPKTLRATIRNPNNACAEVTLNIIVAVRTRYLDANLLTTFPQEPNFLARWNAILVDVRKNTQSQVEISKNPVIAVFKKVNEACYELSGQPEAETKIHEYLQNAANFEDDHKMSQHDKVLDIYTDLCIAVATHNLALETLHYNYESLKRFPAASWNLILNSVTSCANAMRSRDKNDFDANFAPTLTKKKRNELQNTINPESLQDAAPTTTTITVPAGTTGRRPRTAKDNGESEKPENSANKGQKQLTTLKTAKEIAEAMAMCQTPGRLCLACFNHDKFAYSHFTHECRFFEDKPPYNKSDKSTKARGKRSVRR
jgi:hypothetical protein